MRELKLSQETAPILIIVPHEDDEVILFGGLIVRLTALRLPVTVALVTNGDYGDTDGSIGRARLSESLAGLRKLGLPPERTVFLGYADTGMPECDSFLAGLYAEKDGSRIHPSGVGAHTYALPTHRDYHCVRTGAPAPYTRNALTADIRALLGDVRPRTVFTTHPSDAHGDHAALFRFMRELAPDVKIYAAFAHALGGDGVWPLDGQRFTCPPDCGAAWENAVSLTLSADERAAKKAALSCHATALKPDAVTYLFRFIKDDEVYFPMEVKSL